jgi:hypothetical protein
MSTAGTDLRISPVESDLNSEWASPGTFDEEEWFKLGVTPPSYAGDSRFCPMEEQVMTLVSEFYTDTDPEDPVYHDQAECPYGKEIKRNGNDHPGTDNRRRCDWCSEHR